MNTMTDKKVGLFDELMEKKYPDIAIIQADDAYSTDDLFDYVKYCDKGADFKGIKAWKDYRAIKDKVRKKGIGSIIYNDNVTFLSKTRTCVQGERGDEMAPAVLITISHMGTFMVLKDGTIEDV